MRTYASDCSLDHYPVLGRIVRGLCAVAVFGVLTACYVTAGPGNGYAWASADRPGVVRVTLPTVEVVGNSAQAAQSVAAVSCPKGGA